VGILIAAANASGYADVIRGDATCVITSGLPKLTGQICFDPCFSAKRPKIKQFGRLISA
jgi:hypothetical protein